MVFKRKTSEPKKGNHPSAQGGTGEALANGASAVAVRGRCPEKGLDEGSVCGRQKTFFFLRACSSPSTHKGDASKPILHQSLFWHPLKTMEQE